MIYVFLGTGFEEVEALTVVDLLRRAELEVKTVGIGGRLVTGSHEIPVMADLSEEEADPAGTEMIVLPGGMPGTLVLEKSELVQHFVALAVQNRLWIGAICAAPSILGHLGLLKGRQATCYPGFECQLPGALPSEEPVVQDGSIITSRGVGTAIPFALKLVEVLTSRERADKLAASIVWER